MGSFALAIADVADRRGTEAATLALSLHERQTSPPFSNSSLHKKPQSSKSLQHPVHVGARAIDESPLLGTRNGLFEVLYELGHILFEEPVHPCDPMSDTLPCSLFTAHLQGS